MTWCAGPTDAERFLTARTFPVRAHRPKRNRPGKHFSGFPKAVGRLPMTVWWAVGDTVRRPLERTRADRRVVDGGTPFGCDGTRREGPRTRRLEDDLGRASQPGSAPMLGITAPVSLRTGVLWSWRLGTAKSGERQHPLDLLEDLPRAPRAPVPLVCDAGSVGSELIATLLGRGRSFLIRPSSQAQPHSDAGVEVATSREGLFWYGTDKAEKAERPPPRVRVIRVASRKRKNDVWLVTDVLDPGRLSAESAGRPYRMRWESECFFQNL
jgi:DDE family transposase